MKSWKEVRGSEFLRVHLYTFYGHDRVLLVQFVHEIEQQADVGFQKKSIIFARYVEELLIHVYCIWLAESINKWLEGIRL